MQRETRNERRPVPPDAPSPHATRQPRAEESRSSIAVYRFALKWILWGLVRFPLNNSGRRGLSLVVGIVYVLFRSSETMKTLNLSFTWGKGLSVKIWRAKALSGTLFSKRDFLGTFLRKCELSLKIFKGVVLPIQSVSNSIQ